MRVRFDKLCGTRFAVAETHSGVAVRHKSSAATSRVEGVIVRKLSTARIPSFCALTKRTFSPELGLWSLSRGGRHKAILPAQAFILVLAFPQSSMAQQNQPINPLVHGEADTMSSIEQQRPSDLDEHGADHALSSNARDSEQKSSASFLVEVLGGTLGYGAAFALGYFAAWSARSSDAIRIGAGLSQIGIVPLAALGVWMLGNNGQQSCASYGAISWWRSDRRWGCSLRCGQRRFDQSRTQTNRIPS